MASTTTGSISSPGGLSYQNYMNKKVIQNFEPELYFYKMGKKQAFSGYKTISWSRLARLTTTVANATLVEGITPTDQNITEQTITVTPVQYGLYVTLTDQLIEVVPVEIVSEALQLVGNSMARVIDQVIQSMLLTTGTQVMFAGTGINARAALTAANVMTWKTIAEAVNLLSVKSAKRYSENAYVAIAHNNVKHDLFTETSQNNLVQVSAYTSPEKYYNGEIGMIAGCRFIICPFVQTVASTIPFVYPTYVMGADAYGIGELMGLETFDTGFKASDTDPLAQRRKLGTKIMFGSVVLRNESLVRIESASSLNGAVHQFA